MPNSRRDARKVERARNCLGLICDIADRGASSWDAETVGHVLQELSQALLERAGTQERVFEPLTADEILDLAALFTELQLVDGFSQEFCASHKCH
jgi:hypothetical protein